MTKPHGNIIRLETDLGGFVREAEILPFIEGRGPDVIIWGDRCFKLVPTTQGLYRECFAYGLAD
ncbi:MAG: hypothetical protein KME14_26605 [Tildeniella torsiva UHER 1998/13D]|jgi:hypothetical protein|nr:hypothetical protein [Tildeniella torsiva UHER 1998/13D]